MKLLHILVEALTELALTDKPAKDMQSYFKGMAQGVNDKLFFLNQIKPDLIVDFGSADGYVLSKIHEMNPDIALIGYDISPDMIKVSKESYSHINFTDNWSEVESIVRDYRKPCLLLSSVIHEVYSYGTENDVDTFWRRVFTSGFEFVVIRDTIPGKKIEANINFEKDADTVRGIVDTKYLKDYEKKWGPITDSYKNFVRFILMYRYKNNWSRESLEDYLPITYEDMVDKIFPDYANDNYKIIYDKKFKFKPIQSSFSKDFKIDLRQDLHLKMILRKQ